MQVWSVKGEAKVTNWCEKPEKSNKNKLFQKHHSLNTSGAASEVVTKLGCCKTLPPTSWLKNLSGNPNFLILASLAALISTAACRALWSLPFLHILNQALGFVEVSHKGFFTATGSLTAPWNKSGKLPTPATVLLAANSRDRLSHPRQFGYVLLDSSQQSWTFRIQISRVPYYGTPSVLASSFLLGEICTEKGRSLSTRHYLVVIPCGCPGRDQDPSETGTAQKRNENAGHGSGSVSASRHFPSNRDYRDGSFLKSQQQKKNNTSCYIYFLNYFPSELRLPSPHSYTLMQCGCKGRWGARTSQGPRVGRLRGWNLSKPVPRALKSEIVLLPGYFRNTHFLTTKVMT